jgi:DNA or RNA helicases of superfamily II
MENLSQTHSFVFHKILDILDIQSQYNLIRALPDCYLSPYYRVINSLFDYQINSLSIISKNRHHFALYDTGYGKTYMACSAIRVLKFEEVIFVAPKSIHSTIKDTLQHLGVQSKKVDIITHQRFNKDVDCLGKFLIIDEVHNFRNHKTKRYARVLKSCRQAYKLLFMTATPLVNSMNDIKNLSKLCGESGKDVASLVPKLNIVYKAKNDNDFPRVDIDDIRIELNEKEGRNYQNCLNNVLQDLDLELSDRIGKITDYFMLFSNAMLRVGDSGTALLAPKIKYIKDTIHYYDKQIIFTSWIKAGIERISQVLEESKIPFAVITGQTRDREKIIKNYNRDKIKVLVFSKAGSEGINLIGTNRVILLEPWWNFMQEKQAMSRAVRINSHSHLPIEERFVKVERLFVNYPLSIDYLLKNRYIDKKKTMSDNFFALC